ncbi:nitroreductase family protein [Dactylosporangium sp. NPDC049742]|uniref:nitroreductase family protein n=1 Tax=Dactylosporangium sp. NPDC049742 TaxID=3154737 RepID=UPI00341F867D
MDPVMDPAGTTGMSAAEVLTTTRSVRHRLDLTRPVDLADVRACLEVALQAPTGAGRQHWRWLVVTDPVLRSSIGKVYRAAFEQRYPPDATDTGVPPRTLASARHLAEHLGQVPVLVVPCLEVRRGLGTGNQAGIWGSLLPAAWSYMLAARARGLATAWTTTHLDREEEVAALLRLPGHVRQGALIPTAHPVGGGFRPARRAPLDSVIHIDGWNET